jgi:hypothetical protein
MVLVLSLHKKDPPSGRSGRQTVGVSEQKSPHTSLPTIRRDTFGRVTIKGGQGRNLHRC